MSPVEYPTITIGGEVYQLRLTLAAQYRLERENCPVQNLQELLGSGKIAYVTLSFIAACAGQVVDGKWKPIGLTGEEVAERINDMGELPKLSAIVVEVLKKAFPPTTPAATAATAMPTQ